MRIAFIGAPGAGKSAVAKLVTDNWIPKVLDPLKEAGALPVDRGVAMLDGYEKDAVRRGYPVGQEAGFETAMLMHFEHMWQRKLALEGHPERSLIECGSGIERLAHSAGRIKRLLNSLSAHLPETQAAVAREQGVAPALTVLMFEAWQADYAFYLPLVQSQIITPGTAPTHAVEVDLAIQDLMGSFGMNMQMLSGTNEAKADTIIQTVVNLEPARIKGDSDEPTAPGDL